MVKPIKIIIFFSSFALFGFLVVQIYWARKTFTEKKDNYENLIKICVQEIGDELREKILNESKYFNPNIGNKSVSINKSSDNKSQMLDSLVLEINTFSEKSISDSDRIKYYQDHLDVVAKAAQTLPIKGYFAWSLLDNFEWALGYKKRFGLVYVDYETQQRTKKDSFKWWQSGLVRPLA